jgi:hypothetical protein
MQLYRFKKRTCRGGNPLAFLYTLGIFFVDRLFLIVSNGVLDETGKISTHKHTQTNNK